MSVLPVPAAIPTTLLSHAPRRHQAEAVNALINEIGHGGRAQLIHACGTGKTRTSAMYADQVKARCILVTLPSLGLVTQTMNEWRNQFGGIIDYRAVCSDKGVAPQNLIGQGRVLDNPTEIAGFLATRSTKPLKVLFSTYQSSHKIAAAATIASKMGWHDFDLIICDEAHRLAGKLRRKYAAVLDQNQVPAHSRLFMTATPRITNPHKTVERVVGMKNTDVFGQIAHRYTFAEATRDGILSPYRMTVLGIDPSDLAHYDWPDETDAPQVRHTIGLAATLRAMHTTQSRRMVTFHSNKERSERFAESLNLLNSYKIPGAHIPDMRATHLHSGLNRQARRHAMSMLEPTYPYPSVVSNPRVLTEGIDVPALDGVVFVDPRTSAIDTTQAVGRALRNAPGKSMGHIVVPVIMRPGEPAEKATTRGGFDIVWTVLAILKDLDESVEGWIDDDAAANRYETNPGFLDFDIPNSFTEHEATRLAMVARVRAVDHTASVAPGRDTIEVWCKCCSSVLLDRIKLTGP